MNVSYGCAGRENIYDKTHSFNISLSPASAAPRDCIQKRRIIIGDRLLTAGNPCYNAIQRYCLKYFHPDTIKTRATVPLDDDDLDRPS